MSSSKRNAELIEAKKKFCCRTCHEYFVDRAALMKHKWTHVAFRIFRIPGRPRVHTQPPRTHYVCEKCGLSFFWSSSLSRHKNSTERNCHDTVRDRPVSCDECGRKFSSSKMLHGHRRGDHAGQENHKCIRCGKQFLTTGRLVQHALTHPDHPNRCKCGTCGKTFSRPSNLRMHERRHNA